MPYLKEFSTQSFLLLSSIFIFTIYALQINLFGYSLFPSGFLIQNFFIILFGYITTQISDKNKKPKIIITYFFYNFFYPIFFGFLIFFPFIFYFYLTQDFFVFLKTFLFSTTFLSNFYFWYRGDLDPTYFIFQNTWILSIIFQLILSYILINNFVSSFKLNTKIIILFIFFLTSLVISHTLNRNAPGFNFFFFISHLWQFVLGSLIFYIKKKYRIKNSILKVFLLLVSFLAILIILHKDFSLENTPSINTLFPIILFCIPIYLVDKSMFYKHKIFVLKILFNSSLTIFILVSPVIIFYNTTNFLNGILNKFLILMIMLFTALIISNIFLKKKIIKKYFLNIFLISVIIIVPLTVIKSKEILPEIFLSQETRKPWLELKNDNEFPCFYSNKFAKKFSDYCSFENNSDNNLIITGQSYMASLQYDLFNNLKDTNLNLYSLIGNDCDYLPEMKKSIVICHIQNFNSNYEIKKKFTEIKKILKENHVILIMPFPKPGGNLPKKLYAKLKLKKLITNEDLSLDINVLKNNYENHKLILNKVQKYNFENEKLFIYDTHKNFCDIRYCYTFNQDALFYLDEGHPTKYILKKINNDIIGIIKSITNDI